MRSASPTTGDGPANRLVVPAKIRPPAADALPRERLEIRLHELWSHRLGLVVAPAGSGKTTLMARFAGDAGVPVGWYRAETWDAAEATILRHLEAALSRSIPGLAGGWTSIESAAEALEACDGGRVLLVVDDFHALEGTPAEQAFGRFVEYAPTWLGILVGSRIVPDINVPRLRVSGEVVEVDADDLRFRSWEVERLFRDYYGETIPPNDIAILARRTEGWAAGLQLFHLATRGKPVEERRRFLGASVGSGRLVREYLARNVLAELPPALREFLLDTFVLGRLSGDLCDRLRGTTGSTALLEELAHRQIFTVTLDPDDGSYRYHEVLRAHLDRVLVDELGEAGARERHARAARFLEEEGAPAEALAAYCRAEDWDAVQRLLGRQGERLTADSSAWLELLPPALARHDPWLMLATARQARAQGRWTAALEAYARSETGFGTAATSTVARAERQALAAWLDPTAHVPSGWTGQLRSGLGREPVAAARDLTDLEPGHERLVRGILALVAGDVTEAERLLTIAEIDPELGSGAAVLASVLGGIAAVLAGRAGGPDRLAAAAEAADRLGLAWLASRARIAARLLGNRETAGREPVADVDLRTEADPWGSAVDRLLEAWAEVGGPLGRVEAAEAASVGFRGLGSAVLEAWARALGALGQAELEADGARDSALSAEGLARAAGVPGARVLAYAALGRTDPARGSEFQLLADAARRDTGLVLPPTIDGIAGIDAGEKEGAAATFESSLEIRTFGRFSISVDGRALQFGAVRPRARSLLRLLTLHSGTPVHREVLCDVLWPDVDGATGARSLHVAISSLRGQLVDELGPDAGRLIARDGDAYRLAVPDDTVDLRQFEGAIADGRAARARGDRAAPDFARALAIHRGGLLAEEGPADWVVEVRDRCRSQAVEAAGVVASEALLDDDLDRAVDACRAGLELDRYHDPLWRILIQARDRAGDSGAAVRERREYAAVLADLGVVEPVPGAGPTPVSPS